MKNVERVRHLFTQLTVETPETWPSIESHHEEHN